jgi:diaminopimelate epimerase
MKLKFTKMHGAGNDFIVIDGINQSIHFTSEQWRFLADRRFGIGADQILLVEAATDSSIDFRYRIFNADGSEVEQCGNGSRAFVRFVVEKGLTEKRSIRVQTMSGVIEPRLNDDGSITVDMGAPRFDVEQIPFDDHELSPIMQGRSPCWNLDIAGKTVAFSLVSMGNPHAVQVLDSLDDATIALQGPLIEAHPRFPKRVNAGFMRVIHAQHIQLRVYERGAGETLACGTGSCAAVVAGIRLGLLQSPVQVTTRGGDLSISWEGEGHSVFLSGPAVTVFDGEIDL